MTTENSVPETPPPGEPPQPPPSEPQMAEPQTEAQAGETLTPPMTPPPAEEPVGGELPSGAAPPLSEWAPPEGATPEGATPEPPPEPKPAPPAKTPRKSKAAAAAAAAAQEPAADEAAKTEPAGPVNENMRWYVVKVQSGREETIRDAIERRVKIEGLQDCFGQILIPVENYTEMVGGKRKVKKRKLYPGYMMVNLEFNDRMLYLFRETSGVGDFVGGGLNKPPQPMSPDEVTRLIRKQDPDKAPTVLDKSKFGKGDRVSVKDGTFAGMEGEVKEVIEAKGVLRVELTIFGRPVPVELEYWQVDYA